MPLPTKLKQHPLKPLYSAQFAAGKVRYFFEVTENPNGKRTLCVVDDGATRLEHRRHRLIVRNISSHS